MTVLRALQELEKARRFVDDTGRRKMALGCAQKSVYLLREANPTSPHHPKLTEAQAIVHRCLQAEAEETNRCIGAAQEWLQRNVPNTPNPTNAIELAWKSLLEKCRIKTRSKGGEKSVRALPRQLLVSYQEVFRRLEAVQGVLKASPIHIIRIRYSDHKVWVVKTNVVTRWGARRLHIEIANTKP